MCSPLQLNLTHSYLISEIYLLLLEEGEISLQSRDLGIEGIQFITSDPEALLQASNLTLRLIVPLLLGTDDAQDLFIVVECENPLAQALCSRTSLLYPLHIEYVLL